MLHFVLLLWISLLKLQSSSCEEDKRNSLISALEKAVTFLNDKYDQINIDAVLGYSVMEAYLEATQEKLHSKSELSAERERITLMKEKLLAFVEKANPEAAKQAPDLYKAFAPALKPGFWKIPQKWRKINDSIAYTLTRGECLDLETSDSCISALLGTKEDGGESCSVPDNCSRVMTETHCSGYELSHQLFYFLFAKMKGCSNPLFHNARYYESLFCHLMMQANRNLEKMELRNNFADIFTENIMFCGLAGFSDFFKTSWRDFILSKQKQDEGCFWMYSSSNRNEDRVQVAKRSKRSEKIVEGDCSSHNTAVAVGALAGFLYYNF